jgi:hypothetical protein
MVVDTSYVARVFGDVVANHAFRVADDEVAQPIQGDKMKANVRLGPMIQRDEVGL